MCTKIVTVFVLLGVGSCSMKCQAKGFDEKKEYLKTLMTPSGIVAAFGESALSNADLFDENGEDILKLLRKDVKFLLYTRDNMDSETEIFTGLKDQLLAYGFNKSAPTKIICHGFMSNYKVGPGELLVPAYLEASSPEKPINIIAIDWNRLAGTAKVVIPNKPIVTGVFSDMGLISGLKEWMLKNILSTKLFFPPAASTEHVGHRTGALIQYLVEHMGVDLKNIHLIGHSLGAHAMGYTGRFIQENLKDNVGRITALDPAGPCYEGNVWGNFCFGGSYVSVGKTDADFVDVIHTNAGLLGLERSIGHVDFYPNSGFWQNGCPARHFYNPYSYVEAAKCAHRRSIEFMKISILYPDKFTALKCPTWDSFERCKHSRGSGQNLNTHAVMGESCLPNDTCSSEGIFFLKTKEEEPILL